MLQEYSKYTSEDHEVWNILFDKMMQILPKYSTQSFIEGIDLVGFKSKRVPNFNEMNHKLAQITGWQVYAVPGLIENSGFFTLLTEKKFPASTWLRTKKQLDYLEEPDMFHDVFGHIPLLANIYFADFLVGLSNIALKHIDNEWAVELISRIYWFTVEFGLIKEDGNLKAYGAGILSSIGEAQYSINSQSPKRVPFSVKAIFDTHYIKDKFQEKYFVIDSYDQLFNSLPQIESLLIKEIEENKAILVS